MDASVFNEIEWGNPVLSNPVAWAKGKEIVRILCELAEEITNRITNDGGYLEMPYHYIVEGMQINFLPHWNFYTVGGFNLDLPESLEDIQTAIAAIKTLQGFGMRLPD